MSACVLPLVRKRQLTRNRNRTPVRRLSSVPRVFCRSTRGAGSPHAPTSLARGDQPARTCRLSGPIPQPAQRCAHRNANAIARASSTLAATMVPTLTAAHYMRSMRSPPSRVSLVSHMGTSSRERADGPEHDDHRDDNPGDGDGHLHDVEQPSHWDLRQLAFRDLRLGPEWRSGCRERGDSPTIRCAPAGRPPGVRARHRRRSCHADVNTRRAVPGCGATGGSAPRCSFSSWRRSSPRT